MNILSDERKIEICKEIIKTNNCTSINDIDCNTSIECFLDPLHNNLCVPSIQAKEYLKNKASETLSEMRNFTKEEAEAYRELLKSLYEPTGKNFYDL
jgi:hypothetical protein